jgi:hypothetical protein
MRVRYSLILASALMLAIGIAASAPAGAATSSTGFAATLLGSNEVPPNASPASGSAFVVLSGDGTPGNPYSISYSLTYSGLVANRTASHFHGPATPAVNAPVIFGIATAGPTSGTISGVWDNTSSPALNATHVNYLMTGQLYFNVHSQTYPGGEIRGQILLDATPTSRSTWGRIKQLYR